jgi:small conductance mechanosensitive channel
MSIEFIGQATSEAAAAAPSKAAGAGDAATSAVSATDVTDWVNAAGTQLVDLTVSYAPRVGLAILVLVIGWVVIGIFRRAINRVLGMKQVDVTVGHFLASLASIALKVMLLLSVAGMLGIEVTSFIAILSAATLAIGMALKGTLSNFAGGISVMLFRPYKVGDFITGAGQSGSVQSIHIFNTVLTTGDNQTVIIPNNAISTGVLVNSSTQSTRRVQIDVGIGYEDDIDAARKVVMDLIAKDKRVHAEPAPMVAVGALGASSVDLVIRFWVDAGDFWPAKFDFNENLKKAFDAAGINIPYPQQVVHHVHEKDVSAP